MSTEPNSATLRSPGKVNLFLEVLGGRSDGYHDIRSVLVPVSIFDIVEIEKTDGPIESAMNTEGVIGIETLTELASRDNLASRGAEALKQDTACSMGATIRITKQIPVGGGLGGGSADAAAAMTGLNTLWGTKVPKERLMEIASGVGCDIPALIHGGPVSMEGRGERIEPVKVGNHQNGNGWWMVLVNPGFSVSTRDVYARYRSHLTSTPIPFRSVVSAVESGGVDEVADVLFNSLQETVFTKYPLVEMVAEGLKRAGAIGALLSGSGASVFGLARDEAHAREIEASVRKDLDVLLWSKVVKTLPDGVMVAHGPLEARV